MIETGCIIDLMTFIETFEEESSEEEECQLEYWVSFYLVGDIIRRFSWEEYFKFHEPSEDEVLMFLQVC